MCAYAADYDSGARYTSEALAAFPKDSRLHLAAGVLVELAVNTGVRSRRALHDAENDYRRALGYDETNVEARLHLGWVLHLMDSDRAARDQLRQVLAAAVSPEVAYLGRLFLGVLAENARDFAAAAEAYEGARAIGPRHQTPYIALAALEGARGNMRRARELTSALAQLPEQKEEDPWWDYHLGRLDAAALAWLRLKVRR